MSFPEGKSRVYKVYLLEAQTMRSFHFAASLAQLAPIAEHSEENYNMTCNETEKGLENLKEPQKSAKLKKEENYSHERRRTMSCGDLSLPEIVTPKSLRTLRRSQSEISDRYQKYYSCNERKHKTFTDFLPVIPLDDNSTDRSQANQMMSPSDLKEGKEKLDCWMKFFG